MSQIRSLWRKLFDQDPPTHNRQFLERRIAYRLQEQAFAKTDAALLAHNKDRIDRLLDRTNTHPGGRERHAQGQQASGREYRLAPGTALIRQYHGVEHHVLATSDGQYEYQGRAYSSLSMIARVITGCRWSGPLFFGLKKAGPPSRAVAGSRTPR